MTPIVGPKAANYEGGCPKFRFLGPQGGRKLTKLTKSVPYWAEAMEARRMAMS
jgi:hypothetical protein